jgi:lysophospholipid acyltransferase
MKMPPTFDTHAQCRHRIGFFQICGVFERCKYYAIWTLTEGASILTGLGFTGYAPDGASLWDGASNVDVRYLELGPNFKVCFNPWFHMAFYV